MKFITFLLAMGITLLFLQTNQVLGQQQVTTTPQVVATEPVKTAIQDVASEQISTQTLPVDVTMLTAMAGSVGGLLLKDRKDKKDLEEQLKEAVDVLMVLNACYIKFFNASVIYGDKTTKQILQLKSANNALEDSTLAAEMASGIARYQKFAAGNFQLQAPNMTTPSPQVINATTIIPDNKVALPPSTSQNTTQTNTAANETSQTGTNQTAANAGNTG